MDFKAMSDSELVEYATFLQSEIERIKAEYSRVADYKHTIIKIQNELHRRT
jgi:uncharacterized small protein (DUF1192 family)